MTKINWNITDQELKQELVSSDNRWHISKTQKSEEESKFFLTNYDLLLTPHGSGPDYKVCFETFIENCDQYIEKIKKILEVNSGLQMGSLQKNDLSCRKNQF